MAATSALAVPLLLKPDRVFDGTNPGPHSGWQVLVQDGRIAAAGPNLGAPRGVRVVDGLLTGLHEPEASHLLMLEAVAGREAVDRGYEQAVRGRYLWHEFGDVHLVLPAENPHREHCDGNSAS